MARYELYVQRNESNSEKAMLLASARNDIKYIYFDEDVDKNDRPSFLNGVPILLNRQTEELYRGTGCLQELLKLPKKSQQPTPKPPLHSPPIKRQQSHTVREPSPLPDNDVRFLDVPLAFMATIGPSVAVPTSKRKAQVELVEDEENDAKAE